MTQKLFLACKWAAIICFFPAVILSTLNLVNEIWLNNNWGESIGIWGNYFLKVLSASFFLALVIAITDKEDKETDNH